MYVCGLIPVSLFMGNSVLPTADRLIGYAQAVGKFLLRQVVFLSELTDIFSNCQFIFPPYADDYLAKFFIDNHIIQRMDDKINNALREKNYQYGLYTIIKICAPALR